MSVRWRERCRDRTGTRVVCRGLDDLASLPAEMIVRKKSKSYHSPKLTSSLNALSALNKTAMKITPPRVKPPAAVRGKLRYTLPQMIAMIMAVAKLVKIVNCTND